MQTQEEMRSFLEHGYLHVRGVITGDHLAHLRAEFDRVWETEDRPVSLCKLLKHQAFLDLIEHPAILDRHRAIFGHQTQLLQADLGRQGPRSNVPERSWHRDFVFPGERPLAINTLLFLDTITDEVGPTRVVPGTHRGETLPPRGGEHEPLPGEVAVCVEAGDAVLINSAIWHTGGRNQSDGLRRCVYLYYGYWWLRRFEIEGEKHTVPWQALQNASERRLHLLGLKMPGSSLHMYDPAA
jgi:ectoine hydroxylase-related dioxygenase (phytanoyl-CoA dioxygenase family)